MNGKNSAAANHFDPSAPILIVGAGMIGSKVAWACARSGLTTRLYDVNSSIAEEALARARNWGSTAQIAAVARHLSAAVDLSSALDRVQLVFENVPEDLALKQRVLADLGRKAPATAYLGSNTSSCLCTPLAEASGRPAQFFNLNFSDPLHSKLVEYMGSAATTERTLNFAERWTRHIGMTLVVTRHEQRGYSFNRLWRVIKKEVLRQVGTGIATAGDIDRAWMLSFRLEKGPCAMMDEIGLATVLAIEESYFADTGDPSDNPPALLRQMVAAGNLGVSTGRGFYAYPHPAYEHPDFLSGARPDENAPTSEPSSP